MYFKETNADWLKQKKFTNCHFGFPSRINSYQIQHGKTTQPTQTMLLIPSAKQRRSPLNRKGVTVIVIGVAVPVVNKHCKCHTLPPTRRDNTMRPEVHDLGATNKMVPIRTAERGTTTTATIATRMDIITTTMRECLDHPTLTDRIPCREQLSSNKRPCNHPATTPRIAVIASRCGIVAIAAATANAMHAPVLKEQTLRISTSCRHNENTQAKWCEFTSTTIKSPRIDQTIYHKFYCFNLWKYSRMSELVAC